MKLYYVRNKFMLFQNIFLLFANLYRKFNKLRNLYVHDTIKARKT
jgi:hypothetical protein